MTTTEVDTEPFDIPVAEEFGARVVGMLNDACAILLISVGHQTGLFDTLAELPPSTSDEVARSAGLHERYVREWLNAMTTARVVTYDPATRRYALPAEHAASLTRAAGPDNLAGVAAYVPLMAEVEQPIIECFRRGGGLSYDQYPRFHRLMAAESATVFDAALVDRVVPLVPGLADRLRAGIDVLDVGCGSGHASVVLATAFPRSRFVGYDFSAEAIAAGREEAAARGLTNVRLEVRDVAALTDTGAFDLVTAFDAIHDQAHPATVLACVARALRPDGTFVMCDIAASSNVEDNVEHPMGTTIYTFSTMHCMTVSLGLDGDGLGTAWGEQLAISMLGDAGFGNVDVHQVEGDFMNSYYVARVD